MVPWWREYPGGHSIGDHVTWLCPDKRDPQVLFWLRIQDHNDDDDDDDDDDDEHNVGSWDYHFWDNSKCRYATSIFRVLMVVWGLPRLIGTTTATNMPDKSTIDNSQTKIVVGSYISISRFCYARDRSLLQCYSPSLQSGVGIRTNGYTSWKEDRHRDDHRAVTCSIAENQRPR